MRVFKAITTSVYILANIGIAEEIEVLERYTTMRTIAGLAAREDGNFWQARYENSDPTRVELSNPHDCGTDAEGRVYIVDKESHSILAVSPDGSTLTTVAGTHSPGDGADDPSYALGVQLKNPNGLHVFADGSFLILDTDNQKARFVDTNRTCQTLFRYAAGFGSGRGICATSDGAILYFCGEQFGSFQRIKKWTASTGFTTLASLPSGDKGLGNIALAPDGTLIVTAGDHRVYRVTEGGGSVIIAGNGSTNGSTASPTPATSVSLDRVRGVAVLPDGSYFLATQKGGDIWWVDLDGMIHLFVNGQGTGNHRAGEGAFRIGTLSRISEPRAIHLATNGDLLITSNDQGIIRAVTNVCKPTAPQLRMDGLNLKWNAAWNQTFILESATSLHDESWALEGTLPAMHAGEQTHEIPIIETRRFWRLRAPRFAGGE